MAKERIKVVYVTDTNADRSSFRRILLNNYSGKCEYIIIREDHYELAYEAAIPAVENAQAVFFDLIWKKDSGRPPEFPGLNYIYRNLKKLIPESAKIAVLCRLCKADEDVEKVCIDHGINMEYVGALQNPEGKAAIAAVMRDLGVI